MCTFWTLCSHVRVPNFSWKVVENECCESWKILEFGLFQVLGSPGKQYFTVCTNPVSLLVTRDCNGRCTVASCVTMCIFPKKKYLQNFACTICRVYYSVSHINIRNSIKATGNLYMAILAPPGRKRWHWGSRDLHRESIHQICR